MVEFRGRILTVPEAERLLRGRASAVPAFLLATGEEAWLRDRLVAAFRAGGEAEGTEVRRLEGDEISAEDLEGALQALPLFGGGVRLWIREISKLGKAPLDSLLAWTERPPEGVRVLGTTAREAGELKSLETLAARGASASCTLRPADRAAWVKRIAEEAGLKLPAALEAAIAAAAPSLLAAAQEVRKIAALADEKGRVPVSAASLLHGGRTEGSMERWVDALLAGDRAAARSESASLAAAGAGGGAALWALAERALGSLEPGGSGWPRRSSSRPIPAGVARRVLDAVYRADRALKRGELTDQDLMDALTLAVEDALRPTRKERIAS